MKVGVITGLANQDCIPDREVLCAVRSSLPPRGKWDTAMLFSRLAREKSRHSRLGRHTPPLVRCGGLSSSTKPASKKKQGPLKKAKKQLQAARASVPKSIRKALAPSINSAIKSALRGGGAALGAAAGSSMGMGVSGSVAGSKLGARLSKAIGSGDYEIQSDVKANSLFKGDGPSMPSFGSSSITRFKHREYIGDVVAGANNSFSFQKYAVQPAFRESFPYLAQISRNFTRYHMKGLIYEYVSTTSPYLAGGAMGSVIMAMQYDPVLPDYASKPQMENSDFAISARPDHSIMYGVECLNQPVGGYYLRSSASLTTQPLNFTDMGTMYVAVQNSTIPAGTPLGELWVTYDIELAIPLLSPARYAFARLNWDTLAVTSLNSPFTAAAYQGSNLIGDFSELTVTNSGTQAVLSMPNVSIGDVIMITAVVEISSGGTATGLTSTGLRFAGLNRATIVNDPITTLSTQQTAPNTVGQICDTHVATIIISVTGQNPNITVVGPAVSGVGNTWQSSVTLTTLFGSGATL